MSAYNEVILKMLNKAYEYENKSFRGYMHAVVTVTGPLHDLYESIYKKFADLEQEHMYEVGEKITALGGNVSSFCMPIDDIVEAIGNGYDAALKALQEVEDESLMIYKKIREVAESKDDTTLVLLLEHILQEEQEHYDELQRILMDTPGKNNVEMHDELVVDAFVVRIHKVAALFDESKETQLMKELQNVENKRQEIVDKHGKTPAVQLLNHPDMALIDRLNDEERSINNELMKLNPAYKPTGLFGVVWRGKKNPEPKHYTGIVITDANMEGWVKKWLKLNNEMRDMEDDLGMMDEDGDADPEYKKLAIERKDIKAALDDFDDNWMRDYFDDSDMPDEVEPAMTMRDYR